LEKFGASEAMTMKKLAPIWGCNTATQHEKPSFLLDVHFMVVIHFRWDSSTRIYDDLSAKAPFSSGMGMGIHSPMFGGSLKKP
jgi:hypothetical protein